MAGPMDHHWGVWGEIGPSSFSAIIPVSGSRGRAFGKSGTRFDWPRRGVTIAFTEREIPDTLLCRYHSVDSLVGNEEWNSEPYQDDVA